MNDAESRFIAKKVLAINPELKNRRDKEKEYYDPWIGLYIRMKSNGKLIFGFLIHEKGWNNTRS